MSDELAKTVREQETKILKLETRVDVLETLLEMALKHSVANRGTEHAFFNCYTYPHGKFPVWVDLAERVLKQETDDA